MSQVLVVGSLHLDVIVSAPRLPRLDETLMGKTVRYAFGGKGGNQAVAARRMGASVAMAGRVGRDDYAARLRAELSANAIDHSQVRVGDTPSGMSVAILDADGNYGAVVVSGANQDIDPDAIDLPDDLCILVLQNEIPEAVNLAMARKARAMGAIVVLNAAPARSTDPDLLALVDWLVVNQIEAEDMAGPGKPTEQARRLQAAGPRHVVITQGGQGTILCSSEVVIELPARSVQVASTHGAGDMFVGALAARLAASDSSSDAMRLAQAAATLQVATPVSKRSGLDLAAAQRFLARVV